MNSYYPGEDWPYYLLLACSPGDRNASWSLWSVLEELRWATLTPLHYAGRYMKQNAFEFVVHLGLDFSKPLYRSCFGNRSICWLVLQNVENVCAQWIRQNALYFVAQQFLPSMNVYSIYLFRYFERIPLPDGKWTSLAVSGNLEQWQAIKGTDPRYGGMMNGTRYMIHHGRCLWWTE